jgi:Dyp-type peroxidase family
MARTKAPVYDVTQIQGDVLPGFRKDHQAFLLARVRYRPAAKSVLADLVSQITNCDEVLAFNRVRKGLGLDRKDKTRLVATWLNVAFTRRGLRRLITSRALEHDDQSFARGLTPNRRLAEPDAFLGDPSTWVIGGDAGEPDMLISVASDIPALLEGEVNRLRSLLGRNRAFEVFYEDRGDVIEIRRGTEHFGFVDGISRLYFRGFPGNPPRDKIPSRSLIGPEQLLIGHPDQRAARRRRHPKWMTNGSYMVWMRLEQNVPEFWRFCVAGARRLTAEWSTYNRPVVVSPDDFAALLVGRRRDALGTPLSRCPIGSPALPYGLPNEVLTKALNDFAYQEITPQSRRLSKIPRDPMGLRCPLSAHIRKTNPRSPQERDRVIVRRGIPFGPPVTDFLHPTRAERAEARGLQFVSYQRSITNQFEHIRRRWADVQGAPEERDGVDPLIGAPAFADDVDLVLPSFKRPGSTMIGLFNEWVKMTGGAYFFVPSIDALERVLAR